jgi:transcriptional regulator with XRE-family HTH domain
MSTLDEFLRTEVSRRDWSYAELARRSGLPRSTVHKLATQSLRRTPEHRTLSLLAHGLGASEAQVQAMAAESLGYTLVRAARADPQISVIAASLERLSPEDRRHVEALVTSLLNEAEPGVTASA